LDHILASGRRTAAEWFTVERKIGAFTSRVLLALVEARERGEA
jgi:hypothetical protein